MSADGDLPGYRLAASSCGCALQILVEPSSRRHHRWFCHHCLFAVEHLGVFQNISFCQTSYHPDPKYNILLASIWPNNGNFKVQQDGRYHGNSSSDFDRELCAIRRRYQRNSIWRKTQPSAFHSLHYSCHLDLCHLFSEPSFVLLAIARFSSGVD